MGTNTLETAYANGQIIDASHINELTASLLGAVIGRDNSGVPELGKSLGTAAIPWGNVYSQGIILNGLALDPSQITTLPNRIVSGQSRALSELPDFIRANGAALEFTIQAATTNLVLSINNVSTTVAADVVKTGITAAPSTNNTADIDDTSISNDLYIGEDGTEITIDNAGSSVTSRIGQVVALKTPTGEIFKGILKSATKITDVLRGYYFDNAGAPLVRGNLSDNDTVTLMNIGWVFVEDNGTTVDVTYQTPVVSFEAPGSPATGDYWFDLSNQIWKRYSGTTFEVINRILVGEVVSDATNTIASRSYDFSKSFSELNNIQLSVDTSEIVKSTDKSTGCSVYGSNIFVDLTKLDWNITTDLESGQTEAASTEYFLYLSEKGRRFLSSTKPYTRPDLQGRYHPYHSWRCVGQAFNNSGSNLVVATHDGFNTVAAPGVTVFRDEQSSGTNGGGFTAGSYTTRALNTASDNPVAYLSSNQVFHLSGEYEIEAVAPCYLVDSHRARYFNVDDSLSVIQGANGFTNNSGNDSMQNAEVVGRLKLLATKRFELQHRGSATKSSDGYGRALIFGDAEVYSIVKIRKIF